MPAATGKITRFQIDIEERRIFRLIGYKKRNANIDDSIKELVRDEKSKLQNLIRPASIYRILDYEETNKHPIFEKARKVAFCLCTIGPQLEDEVARLMEKNELVRALILDAFGSEAVEEVAIQSDRFLAKKARKMDLWPSKRFSPGYGIWDIKEQGFVFHILPAIEIGMTLKPESYMMIPRKSVSFRINFYEDSNLSKRRNL
jgi:hypothetical protein